MSDLTHIDQYDLPREWVSHADRYHERALKAAEAKKSKELAEDHVRVVRAEVARAVRLNPTKYGLDKPTVAAVEGEVELDPGVRYAEKELIEYRYAYDVYAADVASLEHRKRALEKLVDLLLADFFAHPKEKERGAFQNRQTDSYVKSVHYRPEE